MHAREEVIAPSVAHEKAHTRTALALLLGGIASLIFAVAVLLYVLWMMLATPKATGFDADGVGCYRAASDMSCIKTANP